MERREKIEREVRKTMNCLDGERLSADACFYTRLKARMDDRGKNSLKLRTEFHGWRILAPALLLTLIALNLYAALTVLSLQKTAPTRSEELATLFSGELTLDSSQYNPSWIPIQQE